MANGGTEQGAVPALPPSPTSPAGLIESYKALAERNPRDKYILHWLMMAYLSQKAYIEGIREFLVLVTADRENDQAYMCLGVLYEKGGYQDEAIRSYLRVMSLNPNEELAYLFLSTRYLFKGEYMNAVNVCLSCLELFPKVERLQFNLGYAYAQLREFDKAIEAFQKEIEINPACSEAYYNIDIINKSKLVSLRLGN